MLAAPFRPGAPHLRESHSSSGRVSASAFIVSSPISWPQYERSISTSLGHSATRRTISLCDTPLHPCSEILLKDGEHFAHICSM